MSRPCVSVIVVTMNRREDLRRCLTSVARQTYPDVETIVIDNGSVDGSADMVESEFSDVRLFRSPKNHGCGGGRNIGARMSSGHYLWFIDDDAEVTDPDAIDRLVAEMEADANLGGLGGEAVIDEAGETLGVKRMALFANGMVMGTYMLDLPSYEQAPATTLTGSNMFVRRKEFADLGGFDTNYVRGWEDTDFAYRLRASGKRLAVVGKAPLIHYFSGLERRIETKVPGQSRIYFVLKNYAWWRIAALPLLDLAFALHPAHVCRVANKARRIGFGARGRIVKVDDHERPDARQFAGAFAVAWRYVRTMGAGYVFGWSRARAALKARRDPPDGWQAAEEALSPADSQVHYPLFAAE